MLSKLQETIKNDVQQSKMLHYLPILEAVGVFWDPEKEGELFQCVPGMEKKKKR